MKPPMAVLWFLPLLLVVGVITFMASAKPPPSAPLTFTSKPCQKTPTFAVGGAKDAGGVLAAGTGFRMAGTGWLEARPCLGGVLTITADGEVAGGAAPRLEVALDGEIIASEAFDVRRSAQIVVPHGGVLTLFYANDLYQADVRLAMLAYPRITRGACTTLSGVTVPPESAGTWDVSSDSGSVVRTTPPLVLRPCGAGVLNLQMMGRLGGGEYPVVAFQQAGRVLKKVQTTGAYAPVELQISAEPVEVFVVNPYARLVADRNLNISEIRMVPAR